MRDYMKLLKESRKAMNEEILEFSKACKVASVLVAFGFIVLVVIITVNGFTGR